MYRIEGASQLKSLIEHAGAGYYTLPREVLEANQRHLTLVEAIGQLPTVEPPQLHELAARLARDPADASALVAELEDAERQRVGADRALQLHRLAAEHASEVAVHMARRCVDEIITEHLRPAHQQVCADAREVAAALKGYGTELHALITAPAKARNAYGRLPSLVARRSAIFTARRRINTLAGRAPEHDLDSLFSEFRRPLALSNWQPLGPRPQAPAPADPTERLLWTVGEEGQKLEPWFPTVEEQDAAWWEQFGEQVETRRAAAQTARGIAAQLGA